MVSKRRTEPPKVIPPHVYDQTVMVEVRHTVESAIRVPPYAGYQHIESIEVLKREGLDEPSYFVILLKVSGRRPMALDSFATATDVEHWRQRLLADVRIGPGAS